MRMFSLESLSDDEQVLLAIAVLLDGFEAQVYLENDAHKGKVYSEVLQEICSQPVDVRIAYCGTQLRLALERLT